MDNLYNILKATAEIGINIIVILMCITVHEVAHGYVAYLMGDDTAKNAGRLTLNPIKHLDPIGAICMLLFRFGWAKPVPVNSYRFTKSGAVGIVWVSIAGPASNIIFAVVSMLVWFCLVLSGIRSEWVTMVFQSFAVLNIGLAIFNLIPLPPLDGSKILMYFLPFKAKMWVETNQQLLSVALLLLAVSGAFSRVITPIISVVYSLLANGAMFAAQWIVKLWM